MWGWFTSSKPKVPGQVTPSLQSPRPQARSGAKTIAELQREAAAAASTSTSTPPISKWGATGPVPYETPEMSLKAAKVALDKAMLEARPYVEQARKAKATGAPLDKMVEMNLQRVLQKVELCKRVLTVRQTFQMKQDKVKGDAKVVGVVMEEHATMKRIVDSVPALKEGALDDALEEFEDTEDKVAELGSATDALLGRVLDTKDGTFNFEDALSDFPDASLDVSMGAEETDGPRRIGEADAGRSVVSTTPSTAHDVEDLLGLFEAASLEVPHSKVPIPLGSTSGGGVSAPATGSLGAATGPTTVSVLTPYSASTSRTAGGLTQRAPKEASVLF